MDKLAIVCALILLGLFVVYVINNNVTPKPAAVQDSKLNLGSLSPSPSQTQILNSTPSPTSSQTDNISNEVTAIIKTVKGDITITLYPQDAPNTVANFV